MNHECPVCKGTKSDPHNPGYDCKWCIRQMADNELLDRALVVVEEQFRALMVMHQRHGRAGSFEDACCRVLSGDVISILAEKERRLEEMEDNETV